ncbi:hypothetical protein B0A52_02000 [Exophiala mesophila]|uniref:NTF2-like domain-containing protein n=1 Tax=Exophiala mesophila TaxID=212818 RepID=A0A438NEL9_EXOME|nr:hypothetical protein B0A52_02000 [Exophiala mesophila]
MRLLTFLTPLALSAWTANAWNGGGYCLSDQDAQSIADRSTIFLEHLDIDAANATAQGLFADNLQEFGDSINSLRGDALGTQVENGKAKYIEETLGSPPIPSITTIAIVHGCTDMVWQWQFDGIGTGQYRVRGFTLIEVDQNKQVAYQYVEFNGLAWALDIGFTITPPATGPFSSSGGSK